MPKRNNGAALPVNRTMPHSQEAEDAVIGAFMTDSELFLEYGDKLKEDDFYVRSNSLVFAEIKELISTGRPADFVTISSVLLAKHDKDGTSYLDLVGGVDRLEELTESIPSAANCEYYIDIVKRDSMLRKIIRTSGEIIDNAYTLEDAEKCLASAQAAIFDLGKDNDNADLVPVSVPSTAVMNKITRVMSTKEEEVGLRTFYEKLDDMTTGFWPGQMIVLAARPGCGKTAFSMSIATNIALKDPEKVIATFNLEMSAEELVQRMIVSLSGVPRKVLLSGTETSEQTSAIFRANETLAKSNIYIDQSTGNSADVIMSKCRRLKKKLGRLDLIIIDYLQLMEPTKDRKGNRQQEVSDTSRMIKLMAKELEVPVLVLSQMSRKIDDREVKTPQLSDLRESGAIEQDADIVMFLSDAGDDDADTDKKPIELKIAKQRNGATGDLYFVFEKSAMRFKPAAGKWIPKDKPAQDAPQQEEPQAPQDDFAPSYTDDDVPPEQEDNDALFAALDDAPTDDAPKSVSGILDDDLAMLRSADVPETFGDGDPQA